MVERLTSPANPTLKRIRSLREKKFRRAEGQFLAEGLRIVAEAVEAGIVPEVLVFGDEYEHHPLVERLVATTEQAGGSAIATSRDMLHKLTEKDNPQAVVGVFRQRTTPLAALDRSVAATWVVCQSLKDPGNLGTILRTGDAVGAGGVVLLDDSCDPFSVEAVRASMGALFTQTLVQTDGPSFFNWLRNGPGMLVGASLESARDYQAVRYAAPTFVMMGNEQSGLPATYAAQCDVLVKLPMLGKADSLNVAVATAVLLYEVLNQRRHAR
ncbi:MAG: TrmH family RNA methyltransferase [Janthinobacterium lividum]